MNKSVHTHVVRIASAAGLFLAVTLQAAPSLTITKPTIGPATSTPNPGIYDPYANNGIAGKYNGSTPFSLPLEFHDQTDSRSIYGRISGINFSPTTGAIIGFIITATVKNDNPAQSYIWPTASNFQRETRVSTRSQAARPLYNAVICAEFAGSGFFYDSNGNRINQASVGPVVALNNNVHMHYNGGANRGYVVPGWYLGYTINSGASATAQMQFGITGAGIPRGSALYNTFIAWSRNGTDMLANRANSLKISQWPVPVNQDGASFTTASVFHQ